MSKFKIKNKKIHVSDKRITLDAKHSKMVKHFKEIKKELPILYKKLDGYKKEKVELESLQIIKINDNRFKKIYILDSKIADLERRINDINDRKEEKEYYLNTAHLLYQYYANIKNISTKSEKIDTPVKTDKTVVDFFKQSKNKETDIHNNVVKTKIYEYVNCQEKFKRAKILNSYLKIVEPENFKNSDYINNIDICDNCNIEKILEQSEGYYVCENCGVIDYVVIDSDKPSFKDPLPEVTAFSYQRLNHLNEWLTQFQAKESTDIPQNIIDDILLEIKKERISDINKITPDKIRRYLKKLKYNKYYEHIPHIIYRLTGKPAPKISREMEHKLRLMFKEVQGPFIEVCPKGRKNFLSYSYVLHKFMELLGLHEYKNYFPLLKSREKLHHQDQIWRKICKKLDWTFIRSI